MRSIAATRSKTFSSRRKIRVRSLFHFPPQQPADSPHPPTIKKLSPAPPLIIQTSTNPPQLRIPSVLPFFRIACRCRPSPNRDSQISSPSDIPSTMPRNRLRMSRRRISSAAWFFLPKNIPLRRSSPPTPPRPQLPPSSQPPSLSHPTQITIGFENVWIDCDRVPSPATLPLRLDLWIQSFLLPSLPTSTSSPSPSQHNLLLLLRSIFLLFFPSRTLPSLLNLIRPRSPRRRVCRRKLWNLPLSRRYSPLRISLTPPRHLQQLSTPTGGPASTEQVSLASFPLLLSNERVQATLTFFLSSSPPLPSSSSPHRSTFFPSTAHLPRPAPLDLNLLTSAYLFPLDLRLDLDPTPAFSALSTGIPSLLFFLHLNLVRQARRRRREASEVQSR